MEGVFVVAVDGNIGAGKSTLLRILQDAYDYEVYPEPVVDWSVLLGRFYKDPARWSLCLQSQILLSMHETRKALDASRGPGGLRGVGRRRRVVLVERSPASALVFVRNLASTGHMDSEELRVYHGLHDALSWTPDATLLLDVDPGTCYNHVRTRGRESEVGISRSYLVKLDGLYRSIFPAEELVNTTNNYWIRPDGSDNDNVDTARRFDRLIRELHEADVPSAAAGAPARLDGLQPGVVRGAGVGPSGSGSSGPVLPAL